MSRIDEGRPSSGAGRAGGSTRTETDGTDRALTARPGGPSIDGKMAPMLPELLTRPEVLEGDAGPSDLDSPPAGGVDPPSPTEQMQIVRRAESKLHAAADELGRSEAGRDVRAALEVVEQYRGLKEEVLMRT